MSRPYAHRAPAEQDSRYSENPIQTVEELELEDDIDVGAGDEHAPPAGDDEFCHILSGDLRTFYCGRPHSGPARCKIYQGEALCPSCGKPTCPTCAVMSGLDEQLMESDE
jgi:hypothetical protein